MDTGSPTCSFDAKRDFEVGRRQPGKRPPRPFNQPDAVAGEIFVQTRIEKFAWIGQPIEIKVIQVYLRNSIKLNEGICRTLDISGVSERAQQSARQRGLAGTEVALEPDRELRRQHARNRCAERQRGRLVGQVQQYIGLGMIGSMGHAEISDWGALAARIKDWGRELGFDAIGIGGIDLPEAEQGLADWLAAGFHGEMDYMARHGTRRSRPAELVPGTLRVISARMNYRPEAADAAANLADATRAYLSRYALGRDYHKVIRARLQKLVERIESETGPFIHRVFTDSAPVMEVAIASGAGLGWRGKHTLLLTREAGSWFFLGEILVGLPLPLDEPVSDHCGTCRRCLDVCPTGAIVAPYQVDARRCISYLTIELKGSIPAGLRPLIGNRVYGCDDCQIHCPWNRDAPITRETDFAVRHGLDRATLVDLFGWTQQAFESRMAGSAILRIGYERWLRNLAVGLGNAPTSSQVVDALRTRQEDSSALVREHVEWALARHAA